MFACVIVTVLVSPCVGAMCTWGPVPLAHMCSQHCVLSCPASDSEEQEGLRD